MAAKASGRSSAIAPRHVGEIYSSIRLSILGGGLSPGERLVERSLAEQYQVSRTPIREAIHRLEMEGLVEITRRGAVVVDSGGDQLSELCTVREALEGLAARIAAAAGSYLDIATLRALNDAMSVAVKERDLSRLLELNRAFHETVWNATRNRYLVQQLARVRDLIEQGRPSTLYLPERQDRSLVEHEAILEGIEQRDPEKAEAAAKLHSRNAMLDRLLDERGAVLGLIKPNESQQPPRQQAPT